MLLETLLEWIGKPVEFWPRRQCFANPQDSPSTTPPAGQATSSLDLADAQIELRFVSRSGLDLYVPPALMAKLEIVSMAIAGFIWFSHNKGQDLRSGLRDPRIRSDGGAAKLVTQKSVCVHLADNTHEFSKLG